ncbi:DNA polymerase III subunit delta [Rhizobiaceae bacterium BDR2-2]|uniref:DNA-directed DNA polymerase n=1 Tax=Ectorhizobium quercum TaxID=2965071 RepID=A0AAE3SX85_9HYPH|nr:DNA polymerase III subunit delta [Ectorhizobium quercum]MCX8999503.1 DNA polymerase III subunit delta [Ectorhizobium quercum]
MAEIKSHEFDGFLQKSARSYRIFVIYGPDRGLVSERAGAIAKASGVPLDDPFAVVKLDAGSLQSDPGRLLDEANTIGLFGGGKLIWVKSTGAEKALADALALLAATPPGDSTVIVEAGDIRKGAGLRKIAEPASTVAIIPCYADDARALNALIDRELGAAGLRITPGARDMLLDLIGGDRLASRNELQKLALYAKDKPAVDEDDVAAIIGDASSISTDEAIDAVLTGDRNGFFHAMRKITTSKTPIFLVLQGCLRQFQMLDQMRAEMDERKTPAAQVLHSMGRGLHFKRKPAVEQALRTWNGTAIAREMNRLQMAIFHSRQKPALEESIALHTLLSITVQSSQRQRKSG